MQVAAKAAEHRAEARWFWQRSMDAVRTVVSSRESFGQWAYSLIPDTLAEAWGWVMVLMVGTFAVSCINTLAQSHKLWMDQQQAQQEEQRSDTQRGDTHKRIKDQ